MDDLSETVTMSSLSSVPMTSDSPRFPIHLLLRAPYFLAGSTLCADVFHDETRHLEVRELLEGRGYELWIVSASEDRTTETLYARVPTWAVVAQIITALDALHSPK